MAGTYDGDLTSGCGGGCGGWFGGWCYGCHIFVCIIIMVAVEVSDNQSTIACLIVAWLSFDRKMKIFAGIEIAPGVWHTKIWMGGVWYVLSSHLLDNRQEPSNKYIAASHEYSYHTSI